MPISEPLLEFTMSDLATQLVDTRLRLADLESTVRAQAKDAELERLWDWLKHEDILFCQRSNFFVACETLLFAASVVSGGDVHQTILAAFTGAFIAIVWLYVSHMQTKHTHRPIKMLVSAKWFTHQRIRVERDTQHFKFHVALGQWLPSVFLALWGCLVLSELSKDLTGLTYCVLGLILAMMFFRLLMHKETSV